MPDKLLILDKGFYHSQWGIFDVGPAFVGEGELVTSMLQQNPPIGPLILSVADPLSLLSD